MSQPPVPESDEKLCLEVLKEHYPELYEEYMAVAKGVQEFKEVIDQNVPRKTKT